MAIYPQAIYRIKPVMKPGFDCSVRKDSCDFLTPISTVSNRLMPSHQTWIILMKKIKVVTLSGNLGFPSKTLILAGQIVDAVKRLTPVEEKLHTLAELAPVFGPARSPAELPDTGHAVLRSITEADLLIAVTPVYKGSYTGLFKHVFDFIDPGALVDVPVIPGATGGGDKHALMIEHQLRPLFGFFGALTVPSGIYASDKDYDGSRFVNPVVLERIEAAARQAVNAAHLRLQTLHHAKAA